MRLKRRQDVHWLELPKVESPHCARFWAETNIPVNGHELNWIQGLDDVVWDDYSHNQHAWNSLARERLLDRIEKGEVLLIHGLGSEPEMPVVRQGKGVGSDGWMVDASLGLEAQSSLQQMLDYAEDTRGVWSQIIAPRKEAPKPEPVKEEKKQITVTNPRWEHADDDVKEQRPDVTLDGDCIILKADVDSVTDGTRATFTVYDTSISPPKRIGVARGEVTGNVATADFTAKDTRASASSGGEVKFHFEASVRREKSEQAELPVATLGMVPVIPMVYTTTGFERNKAIPVPEGSYIYVFRNKKLYRELTVEKDKKNNGTKLKELNLKKCRDKESGALYDERDTYIYGDIDNVILVPFTEDEQKESKNKELIEIAVSTVQWGALYIKALEEDDDKRSARTQELNFTDHTKGYEGSTNLAELDSTDIPESISVEGESVSTSWLNNKRGKGLLLAYLQDPVMQAVLLASRAEQSINKLHSIVEDAKKNPHYESAVVAYPLLFSEEVTAPNEYEKFAAEITPFARAVMPGAGMVHAGSKIASWIKDQLNARKQAMDFTDKDKIVNLLQVGRRKTIRKEIGEHKQALTDWLDKQQEAESGSGTQAASKPKPDFIPFTVGIIDYFSLPCLSYYKAFGNMADIIKRAGLAMHTSDYDSQLCLPEDAKKEKGIKDAGVEYLKRLIEDDKHPLHKMLFATEEQISVLDDKPPSDHIVPIDGTGAFRHHALDPDGFKEILSKTQGADLDALTEEINNAEYEIPPILSEEGQVYRRISEFAAVTMAELISQFMDKYLKEAAKGSLTKTSPYVLFTRNAKAANLKNLDGLQMVGSLDEVPPGKVVLGANFIKGGPKSKKNKTAHGIDIIFEDNVLLSTNADHVGGHDPKPNTKAHRNQVNRGGYTPKLKTNERAVFVVIDEDLARYINMDELGADAKSKLDLGSVHDHDARKVLNEADNINSTSMSKHEAVGAGLSALGALFNVWNTFAAYTALKSHWGAQKLAEFAGAVLDLGYAVAQAVNDCTQWLFKAKGVLKTTLVRRGLLGAVGGGAAVLSFALAVWQGYLEFNSGDKDAAAAQAIMAFGFAGGLAAEYGLLIGAAWAGPVGWFAAGLVLLGSALYLMFNDSELEHWAKNSPFRLDDDNLDEALVWMQNDRDGFPTYEYLMSVLFKPVIEFEHIGTTRKTVRNDRTDYTGDFVAKVCLPVMFPHAKVVDFKAEVDILSRKIRHNDDDDNEKRKSRRRGQPHYDESWRKEEIKPVPEQGERVHEEGLGLVQRYSFKQPEEAFKYIYSLKARIRVNDKLQFPVRARDAKGYRYTLSDEEWKEETPGFDGYKDPSYIYGTTTFGGGLNRWDDTESSVPEAVDR